MSAKSRGAMKNSKRQWPKRAIARFGLIVVVIYALIFLTGSRQSTPKLGIDLQGGTRVTLAPQGEEPTQDQLKQARNILEQRVNGMGVSGSEVVINGNTLVITVPGEDASQAQAVGQTSQLFFRPVAKPSMPDMEKLNKELEDMANRWVKYDVLSADEANKQMEQMTKAIAQQEAQMTGKEPKEQKAPKVSAKPLEEPSNSIEQTKRRDEVTEMLLKDRQSEDPTTQAAASALMTCQGLSLIHI